MREIKVNIAPIMPRPMTLTIEVPDDWQEGDGYQIRDVEHFGNPPSAREIEESMSEDECRQIDDAICDELGIE